MKLTQWTSHHTTLEQVAVDKSSRLNFEHFIPTLCRNRQNKLMESEEISFKVEV